MGDLWEFLLLLPVLLGECIMPSGSSRILDFSGNVALGKSFPFGDALVSMKPLSLSTKLQENAQPVAREMSTAVEPDVDIDMREIYFLIMHFLSVSPCQRTYGQLWNELLEHQLLPRRYHAWYSRSGVHTGDENDDGLSLPLSYNKLVERYPHIEKDHLVKLLKQLIAAVAHPSHGLSGGNAPNAADVPTVLGTGSFSLLHHDRVRGNNAVKSLPVYMRWPHIKADQIRGLSLREIGGGFSRHHRAPSIRAACYAIAQPSTMVQKMENIKRLRGHRNAVYCAIFDCSGRYVITGSDDRLVKIWSMETAYCLASCRGHEGDITDLAVSSNNTLVASSSNDCIIRIWRLPDGYPISVLRGHTGAVTAIAFSPRPSAVYQLLSSSDDGTCRIWDARGSHMCLRVYVPRSAEAGAGRNGGPSTSTSSQTRQIFCCAFNANGTVFVTGSSDNLARVWNACKIIKGDHDQPNHEMDLLSGHENDVNYVQFSGCAVASRYSTADTSKEDNVPKFKNSWFCQDNIVTCSRDGSAIIWIPRPRRSHGKIGRWTRAYHLKVPPPPMPPQPPRGGPRQRILPTPRGVNMIIWSLDNRFVLAAIMDCRICVWNAADGSLVHSLTGHSQSTYVLDVHPFNPRIAMSAGYDGKLIVWDIWEGTPIKISEVAHFKLVDGKFSPDGTSIILSDDVGQLYILNTGQGESQKDAKNDQFFLGDYRPLVRDTQGNVIDQETQLVPYRRNMQDLLCDSSMIPYPEPYQSMYQQRRLGGLGLEWDPSFLRVSVENSTLDQDYQILPLPDLDMLINPLPEFIDAVDWEPEIELQSDDTDSEYNVTEEFSSDGEQECLSSSSSGDHDFTSADSDVENSHKDGFRRARRKKKKIKTEIVTSSGRRAKKRTLNECDGRSLRNNRVKFRNGRKRSKRRSSTSKTFRPQRAAARNALSLFSRITGTSTDGEDEYGTEDDISGSESTLLDSGMESDESGRSLQNEQGKHLKGNEISFTKPEDLVKHIEHPETHMANGSRRRLILKLPIRDSTKPLPSNSVLIKNDDQVDIVGPSSRTLEECAEPSKNILCSWDPGCLPEDVNDSRTATGVPQPEQVEDHLNLSEGYKDGKIRWGGVKARTSKRQRIDAMPSAYAGENLHDDSHIENESSINGDIKFEKKYITFSCRSDIQNDGASNDKMALLEEQHIGAIAARDSSPAAEFNESSIFIKDRDNSKSPESNHFVGHDTGAFSVSYDNGTGHPPEMKRASTYMPTKVRFKSKSILRDPNNPAKLKIKSSGDDWRISRCGRLLDNNPSSMDQNLTSEALTHDDIEQVNSNPVDYDLKEPDGLVDVHPGTALQDAEELHVGSSKECNIVYKRSNKLQRPKFDYEGESGDMEESTSNASDQNHDFALSFHDGITSSTRKTRSMGLNASTSDPCSSNKYHKVPHEESKSSVQMTVRLRSTRTRKGSKHVEHRSPTDKRKPHQPTRKQSWLMLPYHEYGPRYIPQQGDEVVYFRQGHQEYIESSGSRELGPWISVEGDVRAVEFCKVKGLEYATLAGSGESCCKMIIQFVDSDSGVFGKTFKLTLPEVTSFPDFLVEKGRFDDAMRRNWAFRDKCLVWWKNYGEEDGSWWEGRVSGITPKSLEFPDSPWDRYIIQYKGSSSEIQRHSPWELYDRDTRWEEPHIDDDIRKALLSSLDKLMESAKKNQDYYGVRKLKEISQKSKFINRFPVPLSLEVIHLRLQNNYYRSLEAMEHDAGVMLKNVETYVGKKVKDSIKLRRLSDWFKRILSQRSRKHSFVEVSA